MASRITDYARPSEVLLSEAVAESGAPAGTALEELGAVELKGIGDPVRLFRAVRTT
jgi:class 3 adenylate cyclase